MDPIRYSLTFPAPHTHYVEVRAEVPTSGRDHVELMMAVWTPGSYLIREYQRHVESVAATGAEGASLPVRKTAKNRWTIATGGAETVVVTYRVYGREMSVRTNWIESGFALINGSPTFLTLAESHRHPHEVSLTLPDTWSRAVTSLPVAAGSTRGYCASSFDVLVDSPILAGSPAVYEFEIDGRNHRLVCEGEAGVFDGARAVHDLQAITREQHRFWRAVPYDRYVWINLITESGGGLEHSNSAVLMTSRWATRTRKAYLGWLELASHEFFHVWNGKRLRPIELGPFDYERETYTRSLWVVEGITDYYGDLLLHRAGLSTRDEFLASLSDKIEALQTTPGRNAQSLSSASFDAWIKLYRPDENSPNASISYYVKGAIVAFLLDMKIRHASHGARSLDDVMRLAYERYSVERGYEEQEFRALVEEVAGARLDRFWGVALESTSELEYSEALEILGLRFKTAEPHTGRVAGRATIGATTKIDNGRLIVSQVKRGTAAHGAGLNVDDEIIAIDDFRVRPDQLEARMEQYVAGDPVSILVARRERLVRLDARLGSEPLRAWQLEVDPGASTAQRRMLDFWLAQSGIPGIAG
jgi:predicted metalloprotease with PDZ domain